MDATEAKRPSIHEAIRERVDLAESYALDGAFYTASKIFSELGDALWAHADATSLTGPQTTAERALRLAAPALEAIARDSIPILEAIAQEREEATGEVDEVLLDLIERIHAALPARAEARPNG